VDFDYDLGVLTGCYRDKKLSVSLCVFVRPSPVPVAEIEVLHLMYFVFYLNFFNFLIFAPTPVLSNGLLFDFVF
jgi:hypothetical protein